MSKKNTERHLYIHNYYARIMIAVPRWVIRSQKSNHSRIKMKTKYKKHGGTLCGDIQYRYESCNGRKPWTMRPFRIQCGNWRASDARFLTGSSQTYQSAEVQTWRRQCSEFPFIHINQLRCKLEGVSVQSFHSYISISWGADLKASVFRVSIHAYQSAEVRTWRRQCSEFPFIHINQLRCKLEGVSVQSFHSYISICWGADLKASVFRVSIHTYQSAEVQTWRRLCSEFPFIHINQLRCKLEGVSVQSFRSYISICWGANLKALVFKVSTSNTSQTFVYNFKLINLTPQMH